MAKLHFSPMSASASSASLLLAWKLLIVISALSACASAQGGSFDFGEGRYGEKRGQLSPGEIAAIILVSVAIVAALGVTLFFCYRTYKRHQRRVQQRYGPGQGWRNGQ